MKKENFWIQSTELAAANFNETTTLWSFEVTNEQKEYLESHIAELDEWCSDHLGEYPNTVKFEKFFNGTDDCWTCDCYFNLYYTKKTIIENLKEDGFCRYQDGQEELTSEEWADIATEVGKTVVFDRLSYSYVADELEYAEPRED